jgi:hypothetical protein
MGIAFRALLQGKRQCRKKAQYRLSRQKSFLFLCILIEEMVQNFVKNCNDLYYISFLFFLNILIKNFDLNKLKLLIQKPLNF